MSDINDEAMRREEERLQRHLNGTHLRRTVCIPIQRSVSPSVILSFSPSTAGEKGSKHRSEDTAEPCPAPQALRGAYSHCAAPETVCCLHCSSSPSPSPSR